MTPVVGSPPWTPKKDETPSSASAVENKCRGDGRADERSKAAVRNRARPFAFSPTLDLATTIFNREMARVRFVSLSPPNKRSFWRGGTSIGGRS